MKASSTGRRRPDRWTLCGRGKAERRVCLFFVCTVVCVCVVCVSVCVCVPARSRALLSSVSPANVNAALASRQPASMAVSSDKQGEEKAIGCGSPSPSHSLTPSPPLTLSPFSAVCSCQFLVSSLLRRCTGARVLLSSLHGIPAFICRRFGVQNEHPAAKPFTASIPDRRQTPKTAENEFCVDRLISPFFLLAPLTRLLGYRRTTARRGPSCGADR